MMQVDSQKPARTINQPHIHTLTGFSYLTIFVERCGHGYDQCQKAWS